MRSWFGIANNRNDLKNWQEYSVPVDRLQRFVQMPVEQGPQPGEMLFDTSASSAADMAKSPWNRTIIEKLADRATETSSENPSFYASDGDVVDWSSLFKERIYRHLLAIHQAKQGVLESEYEAQKICAIMIEYSRHTSDNASLYWVQTKEALDQLTVAGMSDDEEVYDEAGRKRTLVHSPPFRSSLYDKLFDIVAPASR